MSCRPVFRVVTALAAVLALSGLGGCPGEDDEPAPPPGPASVFISIDATAAVVPLSVVQLTGPTECDNCPPTQVGFGYCPEISCPVTSGITITWNNLSTGQGEPAPHGIGASCSCLFSYCFSSCHHGWWAFVPLKVGENRIEVRATSAEGGYGSDARTLTRVPYAPATLTATGGQDQVTLSWTDVTDATSYNLYWSDAREVTSDTGTRIEGVSSPHVHSGLTNDLTYFYRVTAVQDGYESFDSPMAWATPGWRLRSVGATEPSTESRDVDIAVAAGGQVRMHYAFDKHIDYASYQYNYYLADAGADAPVPQLIDATLSVDAALALDSTGAPHISYSDFPSTTVYATQPAGTWVPEAVDGTGGCASDVVIDANDKAHLAYFASGGDVRYTNNASGSWAEPQIVEDLADAGCYGPGKLALAVDGNGVAHVLYTRPWPDSGLRYATNAGGNWTQITIDTTYVMSLTLALDADGHAHVAYTNNESELKYGHYTDGSWNLALVETRGSPIYPSLVVDATGAAHLSYLSAGYGELRYASNPAGEWRIALVDNTGYLGYYAEAPTALALDGAGHAHIGYFEAFTGSLRYATNRP